MICPFCQKTFAAREAEKACRNCALFGGCQKVKCPYCGYESPREPDFLATLRKLGNKLRRHTDAST